MSAGTLWPSNLISVLVKPQEGGLKLAPLPFRKGSLAPVKIAIASENAARISSSLPVRIWSMRSRGMAGVWTGVAGVAGEAAGWGAALIVSPEE